MAEKSEASVEMKQHDETYQGFIHLTTLTVAFCISVVVMLAVGNAGAWGLAGFGVFLAIVGAVVGFVMNGSPIPIAVFTLGVLVLKLLIG
ncbi:aa3-type cytochrome c oxidase subunit IV [Microbaculum sp. FT89]|uniref:aa3-type cytochrome c oxidase subunit IV n=1 Tax=Microbaculum sp. FT89 TaxID=3447298 RepID=UPI003F533D49